MKRISSALVIISALAAWPTPQVLAATTPLSPIASCQKDMKFAPWMEGLKKDAIAQGVSQKTIDSALPQMTFSADVIKRDHNQSVFQQTFLEFSERMANPTRIKLGQAKIKANRALFDKIEKEFGVPAAVIVSFWGLESDFSANTGKFSILSATTTLAYDCRRADFFRQQLIDALRIIERGDLTAEQMIGNWAGEIGGTQLTPTDYMKFAIDYDGDGKADLVHSIPDTLATAANFLKGHGWQPGQPWLQEAKAPSEMKWQEADMTIQHPLSQWESQGVTAINGKFPAKNYESSLLLPMGRLGPAFITYPTFKPFSVGILR